jgi:hypothetical protein
MNKVFAIASVSISPAPHQSRPGAGLSTPADVK